MIYAVSYTCINALGPSTCDGQINYLSLSIRHDATDATYKEDTTKPIPTSTPSHPISQHTKSINS